MNLNFSNADRAEVLTQALPYFKKYYGKTIVVKYGGNAMLNDALQQQVMQDIVLLHLVGIRVVLVHGGGPELTSMLKRVGKESRFVNGLRVTDKETVDIAQMVLAGKINKTLVTYLEAQGGDAIGLSGMDGRMMTAKIKDPELGYVGEITKVNPAPIKDILEKGYIPVVSSIGCDKDGNVYNINADTAASRIASALHAQRLILMTNIQGLMRDKDDPNSLMSLIELSEAEALIGSGVISGGMIPKIECCISALKNNVSKAIILDGRIPHAVLIELFTDSGAGTMLVKKKKAPKAKDSEEI
ncbi:MAG: acetylglutamate kinase [Sutterellaceae bacterium]|nr:acetylglutamate kinase [Sutterellaceae bacterium]MDD7442022.1 acetylglutamate kinase [Sutterellaceae bacterium]MDY2867903.1 acetylglutamate kinase [Mesosutterella sp.]